MSPTDDKSQTRQESGGTGAVVMDVLVAIVAVLACASICYNVFWRGMVDHDSQNQPASQTTQGATPVVAEPYIAPAPQQSVQSPTIFLKPYIHQHTDVYEQALIA